MTTSQNTHAALPDPGRLIALIDGVFAVAMTLLVLDLKLPPQTQGGDLARALLQMLPALLVYVIAFASVAGYWMLHHSLFRHVACWDGRLVLLSLVNLLFVTLFPVTANIVGTYPQEPLATACLSANSLLYCLSAGATWSYLAAHRHLLVEETRGRLLRQNARVMVLVAAGLALAIPLAFLSVYLAYALWIMGVPVAAAVFGREMFG